MVTRNGTPTKSATVIPFRDPDLALEGEAREVALKVLREALPALVHSAVCTAQAKVLAEVCRIPDCGELPGVDVLLEFVSAMRRELARAVPEPRP